MFPLSDNSLQIDIQLNGVDDKALLYFGTLCLSGYCPGVFITALLISLKLKSERNANFVAHMKDCFDFKRSI